MDVFVRACVRQVFGQFGTTSRFYVDTDDGSIRAWDDVAGHYTRLHSLSTTQLKRIRRLSRARHEESKT